MVVQASSEIRKPSLMIRLTTSALILGLPGDLLSRRLASRVLAEYPTEKPKNEFYGGAIFGRIRGYQSPLCICPLDVAKRAYGKYSSSRARDLLLSGQVKCFYSTVVLASRLTDVADARAVLDSGNITDSDVREMIQYNLENPEPVQSKPQGIWHMFGLDW